MAGGLALALSGGGARGAFQVGVIDELIRVRGVEFETAAGTSTGAIQAAAVAQDDVARLVDFWTGLTGNSSIFTERGGAIWALLTGKDSLYNSAPLEALLDEMFDDATIRATGKALRLAMANLATGELRIVGENADGIANWVYASSAQPPFFLPFETVSATGEVTKWIDGGVRDITPLAAALAERPRAVLAVRAEAPLPPSKQDFDNMLEIGLQSVELLMREVGNSDLQTVELMNDMLTAAANQHNELSAMGLSAADIDRAMRPMTEQIEAHHFAPTLVLQPETELYERLEFEPALIAQNIERGRQTVRDRWDEITAFLGVSA